VLVNAHVGRIVRVVPVGMRYAAPLYPYARPPGAVAPYGYYGPNARMNGPANEYDDEPVGAIPRVTPGGLPPAPGQAGAPNPSVHARLSTVPAQPPLPRPRPKLAATDTPPPASKNDGAPAVKPPAPPVVSGKPPASPTDGASPKPSAAPLEQHE